MASRTTVIGQRVDRAKVQQAREFRRKMTQEERLLWQALRTNKLKGIHFRRQQIIDGFIVDFYCHSAGLVVEVDGPSHQQQLEYDIERDRILIARGLRVLRVANGTVRHDLPAVLAKDCGSCCIDLSLTPLLQGEGSGRGRMRLRNRGWRYCEGCIDLTTSSLPFGELRAGLRGKGLCPSPCRLVGEGPGERSGNWSGFDVLFD